MRIHTFAAACAMTACTPSFNWREVPITPTPLMALFPCKPVTTSRRVTMGGQETELHMAHCDTAGVTVAVGHTRIEDAALVPPVLAQWRDATLAGMRVTTSVPFPFAGAAKSASPGALAVDATGLAADGKSLKLKAAWFAHQGEVYAALWYGQAWSVDEADNFFASLRFR